MFPLYEASGLLDAQLLVDRLESHNIRTYVRNSALQGSLGELPIGTRPQVCVLLPGDLERAQVIVAEYRQHEDDLIHSEVVCEYCDEVSPGNFEICWKCRQSLGPEPA